MLYLTPSGLRDKAPATQKLAKSDNALVDTSAFLGHVAQEGYKPVYAAQGKAHVDVNAPRKGRHFVVAANGHGNAYAILNSHTVYRRAWLAAGYYTGVLQAPIMGAVVPLPRWRGFEEPLAELASYREGLETAMVALQRWEPTIYQRRWLAKKFASAAYLPGHKPASAKALLVDPDIRVSGWEALLVMTERVLAGGLVPGESYARIINPRKVKPIKGPDALMRASNAAFRVGLDAMRKYHLSDIPLNFPSYKRT